MVEEDQIQVRTFQGTLKQSLPFSGAEGNPICVSIGGDFITGGSTSGWLKIWHIGRREGKIHLPPLILPNMVDNFGEIIQANTNALGDKVAFIVAQVSFSGTR